MLEYCLAIKREQTTDRHNNVDAFQKHYDNWRNRHKRVHIAYCYLYKTLEHAKQICSGRKQISFCLRLG